jgi:hypothetical protein
MTGTESDPAEAAKIPALSALCCRTVSFLTYSPYISIRQTSAITHKKNRGTASAASTVRLPRETKKETLLRRVRTFFLPGGRAETAVLAVSEREI